MRTSETLSAIAPALLAAQKVMDHPAKNETNPHLRNKFADLLTCINAARPALNGAGISMVQTVGGCDGVVSVTTRLLHESGEWIEDTVSLALEPQKGINMPQVAGIATTYLRRYGLNAICCVVGDPDNDGNEAKAEKAQPAEPAPKPAVKPKAKAKKAPTFPYKEPPGVFLKRPVGDPCGRPGCDALWPCDDHPGCPRCGGKMNDHRTRANGGRGESPKTDPKYPDFRCADGACLADHRDHDQQSIYWPNQWQKKSGECRDANAKAKDNADAIAGFDAMGAGK